MHYDLHFLINLANAIIDDRMNYYGSYTRQDRPKWGYYINTNLVNKDENISIKLFSSSYDFNSGKNDKYTFQAIDLIVIEQSNHEVITKHIVHAYMLGSGYYTTDINEVIKARDINIQRYIEYHQHKSSTQYFDVNKLSSRLKDYISNKINNKLLSQDRTNDYIIRDLYTRYEKDKRQCIAVIKHDDSRCSEAIYLI